MTNKCLSIFRLIDPRHSPQSSAHGPSLCPMISTCVAAPTCLLAYSILQHWPPLCFSSTPKPFPSLHSLVPPPNMCHLDNGTLLPRSNLECCPPGLHRFRSLVSRHHEIPVLSQSYHTTVMKINYRGIRTEQKALFGHCCNKPGKKEVWVRAEGVGTAH